MVVVDMEGEGGRGGEGVSVGKDQQESWWSVESLPSHASSDHSREGLLPRFILLLSRPAWQFAKINAEKSPYLVEKLNVYMMPTLLLIKDGQTVHHIRGFDEFGGSDRFSTDVFAFVLSSYKVGVCFRLSRAVRSQPSVPR